MQLEWANLPPGQLLQRFGHFTRIVGHIMEEAGHLAEVIGEEISSQQDAEAAEELEESSYKQGPGRPTTFVAKSTGSGSTLEHAALPENTPLPEAQGARGSAEPVQQKDVTPEDLRTMTALERCPV